MKTSDAITRRVFFKRTGGLTAAAAIFPCVVTGVVPGLRPAEVKKACVPAVDNEGWKDLREWVEFDFVELLNSRLAKGYDLAKTTKGANGGG